MEDLTLAIVTVGTFVFLFVVAVFADKAGAEMDQPVRVHSDDRPVAPPVQPRD